MNGSVMNGSITNVVCNERVCYERGLSRMVCYEQVCLEREPFLPWFLLSAKSFALYYENFIRTVCRNML